jgi:acetoin utilization protein AcuB
MNRLDAKRSQVAEVLNTISIGTAQQRLFVREVMTPTPFCIDSGTDMLEILRIFHKNRVRHLLVTDVEGRLLGLVSERDVLRCFGPGMRPSEKYLSGITDADVLSSDPIAGQFTTSPDTPLKDAVTEMIGRGIDCLPIMEGDRPIGILTATDLNIVLEELLRLFLTAVSVPPIDAGHEYAGS